MKPARLAFGGSAEKPHVGVSFSFGINRNYINSLWFLRLILTHRNTPVTARKPALAVEK
jgi:hypothetical protein